MGIFMDIAELINDKTLKIIVERVKLICSEKIFSDIIDDEGNQYVDLVMEGGGMLGVALVGYVYVLEQAGIRFLGLGGTSAGSINALLLAALGEPSKAKGAKLLKLLATKNFYDFVDGDSDAKEFLECWSAGSSKIKLAIKAVQVIDNLRENLGLNPGKQFELWIEELLKAEQIHSYNDLLNRMNTCPKGLRLRSGELLDSPEKMRARLAIIAADVSTETKVEFPRMAKLYWKDPGKINPAVFVRASMSIPFFFHPYVVENLPDSEEMEGHWRELAGYVTTDEGGIPKTAMFVDGGIMSNFPIDVFHDHKNVPKAPTFGVKLELDQRAKVISGPLELLFGIFNCARHTLDYDFLHKNPDYQKLVTWIPAKGFDWLDFNMEQEKKIQLFLEGARYAEKFLATFDWSDYKKIRGGIAAANSLANKK
jgi:NTE family protein